MGLPAAVYLIRMFDSLIDWSNERCAHHSTTTVLSGTQETGDILTCPEHAFDLW